MNLPPTVTEADLDTVRGWLQTSDRVVVLTGAGISTDSGIPDFRGPNGLWTRNPAAEKAATLQHYLGDPVVRQAAWQNRLTSSAWEAQPNAGHRALVQFESTGRLAALVTQNVDELHQRAGTTAERVIEVHGTMHWTRCWSCSDRRPMAEAIERVRRGAVDPSCEVCDGILKSDTISFGQALDPDVIDAALNAAQRCDLLMAIGTSLAVYPVANMVPRARAAGARVVILNGEPTKMDSYAHMVLRGSIGQILPAVVASRNSRPSW